LALAVITLTISGIFYFIAPASPGALELAKDRISGAISGLLILLLTYMIVVTINPSLATFRLNPLEKIEAPEISTDSYGINFYKSTDCSNPDKTSTLSIPDFGDLTNKVNRVKVSQNYDGNVYYISILYDNANYWGKCQYVDPNNSGCQTASVSVASASIYKYDFSPDAGGSVTLYRKSFNMASEKNDNKDEGYLKISSSQISKLYFKKLSELSFMGDGKECTVPKNERDCIKWAIDGRCTEYQCPLLDKENITSIKISGDYIVLLIYIDPLDNTGNYTYSYCQAFPTKDDTNKDGPQQIKWDSIRASNNDPNYILIIPIENK